MPGATRVQMNHLCTQAGNACRWIIGVLGLWVVRLKLDLNSARCVELEGHVEGQYQQKNLEESIARLNLKLLANA